jgi:hypothetical protein
MALDDKRKDLSSRFRTMYDLTMGILWTGLGIFVLFHEKWGYDLKLGDSLKYILGISSTLYGLFRIYRGFKNK